jgi:hypothetical protein
MGNYVHIILYSICFLLAIAGLVHNWLILWDVHAVGLTHIKTSYHIRTAILINMSLLGVTIIATGVFILRELLLLL